MSRRATEAEVKLAVRALTADAYDYSSGTLHGLFSTMTRAEIGVFVMHMRRWKEKGSSVTEDEEGEIDRWRFRDR